MNSAKLIVGNLPAIMRGDDLRRLFEGAGDVVRVEVCADKYGQGKTGMVEMTREEDAEMAIEYLNGATVDGNQISVAFPDSNDLQSKEDAALQLKSTPNPLEHTPPPQ